MINVVSRLFPQTIFNLEHFHTNDYCMIIQEDTDHAIYWDAYWSDKGIMDDDDAHIFLRDEISRDYKKQEQFDYRKFDK